MAEFSRRLFTCGALGLAAVLVIAMLFAGCVQQPGGDQPTPTQPGSQPTTPPATISVLKLSGSTTVLPIAQKAADAYMADHAMTDIQIASGGSSVGVQAIGEKTVDIGMSSRDLKAEEKTKYPDLVETIIANDGIAIIVNPANTVSGLTLDQIKAIYNGSVTNWKTVGGPDQTIVVVGRDSASGTREFFSESVMKKTNYTSTMLEKNSNGAVKQTITQTPGAIGYVGIGYVDKDVKAVPVIVNGTPVQATIGTVIGKTYPISRPLLMITQGPPAGLAKSYIDFILSPAGQKIVTEEGFVPLA
jgi:phosphate transport system substrate-binding protein